LLLSLLALLLLLLVLLLLLSLLVSLSSSLEDSVFSADNISPSSGTSVAVGAAGVKIASANLTFRTTELASSTTSYAS
jgi:hypothetical protein